MRLLASDLLKEVAKLQTELFDVTATKDWANCEARADIKVDGRVLLEGVPVTYLLFLEKQLNDLRTFVDKLPVLDENEDWNSDPNSNLFRTERITTHKTKKTERPIVLYDAVIKDGEALPAQTQLVTEDVIVGWWDTVKISGAIPQPRKQQVLDRIHTLTKSVKFAREEANSLSVEEQTLGAGVFAYLFE